METLDTVLVDCRSELSWETDLLRQRGHDVVYCPGSPLGASCPILGGDFCAKVAAASGVIFDLDLDRAEHRAILAKYRGLLGPEIPIRVLIREDQVAAYPELFEPVQMWIERPTPADVIEFAAALESIED